MKIYLKEKQIISNYVWREFFCWYPVLVEDIYSKAKVWCWMINVWRRGPFPVGIDRRVPGYGYQNKTRTKYDYRLDNPNVEYRFCVSDPRIIDAFIDSPDDFNKKLKEEMDIWTKWEKDKVIIEKNYKNYKERFSYIKTGTPPPPLEELSGIIKPN